MTQADSIQGATPPIPGALVRAARDAILFSQDQLARAAGVSVSTVARLERGSAVSAESLKAVCAVLGLDAIGLHGSVRTASDQSDPAEASEAKGAAPVASEPAGSRGRCARLVPWFGWAVLSGLLFLVAGEAGTQSSQAALDARQQALGGHLYHISAMLGASEANKASALYSRALPEGHPDRAWAPWGRVKPITWFSCNGPSSYAGWVVDLAVGRTRRAEDYCLTQGIPQRLTRRDAEQTDIVVGPIAQRELAEFLPMLTADPTVSIRAFVSPLGDIPPDGAAWFDPRAVAGQAQPPTGAGSFLHLRLARAR